MGGREYSVDGFRLVLESGESAVRVAIENGEFSESFDVRNLFDAFFMRMMLERLLKRLGEEFRLTVFEEFALSNAVRAALFSELGNGKR